MNEQDKEAFEKWYHIANVDITGSNKDDIKTTWQAALEHERKQTKLYDDKKNKYFLDSIRELIKDCEKEINAERERSMILVQALEFTEKGCFYTHYEDSVQVAREALAKYKGNT